MKFGSLHAKTVVGNATLIRPALATGQPYEEVKAELIQQGWQPVKNTKIGNSSLYAQEVYQQGMEEVVDCVSMELDGCWFKYKKSKHILEVNAISKDLKFESIRSWRL